MKKNHVVSVLLLASIVMVTAAVAQKAVTLKIGINAEITGDIPEVGGPPARFAAQMWVEDVNKAGGIEVGGKKYKVELAVEDDGAEGGVRGRGGHQADHCRRGDRHRRPPGLQAGRPGRRGLQQLQDPDD